MYGVFRRPTGMRRSFRGKRKGWTSTARNRISLKRNMFTTDRQFVWFDVNQIGHTALGNASASFAFQLNDPVLPFNTAGGSSTISNPGIANNILNPNGLRNLLFSVGSGTGLWINYRVWRVRLQITTMPQAAGDTALTAVAPVLGGSAAYGSALTCGQGPQGCAKVVEFSVPANANTLYCNWSLPQVFGIPEGQYAAASSQYYGQYGNAPSVLLYAQYFFQTTDGANTLSPMTYYVKVRYYTELFGRNDVTVLD